MFFYKLCYFITIVSYMTTLKVKLKYNRMVGEKYPISIRPEDIKLNYRKYGDKLRKNAFYIDAKL